MNARSETAQLEQFAPRLTISGIERETGLSKDTLRVWERRYGFPMPGRDAFGERLYTLQELSKLRVICRLLDSGYRPGKIVNMTVEHLEFLAKQDNESCSSQSVSLVNHDELDQLRRSLFQASVLMGLEGFIKDIVAPLNARIGEAWASGDLAIFEEHLYTESIQVVLRNAISTIPPTGAGPKMLLTTFPIEPHGLGLLMAEAILALHGAKCISLGVQTPIRDIVGAALAQSVNAVALSFSSYLNSKQVIDGLNELRQQLPSHIEIWAGGLASILQRKPPQGIRVVTSLGVIPEALANWRISRNSPQQVLSSQ
jgi:MerR family transcriptional regulator, light-induced transcriptional regulator